LDPKKEGLEIRRGYDYIDPMLILERGLTPELFHSQMNMIEGVEGNRTGVVEQMKNIYGLNYTGAAVLYQNYQDKVKEYGSDKKGLEEYFSGSEWEEELKSFQDNPNYKSNETLMLSYTENIKKYTQQIGQWELDKKLPILEKELEKAWIEAVKLLVTNDKTPGNNDGDGSEPVEPIVPPTQAKVEETLATLKSVAENPSPQQQADAEREALNNAIEAQAAEGMRQANIKKMLYNGWFEGGTKIPAFFTNTPALEKNDPDQAAYKNFQIFGKAPEGTETHQNYLKSIDILGTFTDAERQYVNDNNSINTAVIDAMTDRTGQRLVELLTELRDNTRELHIDET
jgi:hypothetical protein